MDRDGQATNYGIADGIGGEGDDPVCKVQDDSAAFGQAQPTKLVDRDAGGEGV